MKYIDAERLKTTKELIRQNIDAYYAEYKAKFHQNGDSYHLGIIDGLDMAERILDTLEEPVTDCHDLEEAKEEYLCKARRTPGHEWMTRDIVDAFKAGAEWQKAKMMGEATYNELMEQYIAIRDELVKRHRDVPINIKEKL